LLSRTISDAHEPMPKNRQYLRVSEYMHAVRPHSTVH
jgi:hypothetical protein